jgi:hypothetical protein
MVAFLADIIPYVILIKKAKGQILVFKPTSGR